ncbi:protein Jade-1 isoform X3 [Osmerus eperlanus]
MKRTRHDSSSEDSDHGRKKQKYKEREQAYCLRSSERRGLGTLREMSAGNSTSWSQQSKLLHRKSQGTKPSEVFRTDLITAMKLHDSCQLAPEEFYVLADPWRQQWEKGVQVPVSPQSIPQPVARLAADQGTEARFTRPKSRLRSPGCPALGYVDVLALAEGTCRYDLNEQDVAWLHIVNQEFCRMGMPVLDEITMERVMEEFERRCYDNMSLTMKTEEGLGIEYDEDVVCDVCQSPDGEDNNEMVFCDKCNICVHQACYGIQKVPAGSWLCRSCALGLQPRCQLCPREGGAMKPTRSGTKWVHVSCALWIPEVSIGNPEKMEPITNISQIPSSRWALLCCLCKKSTGACIQCSAKNCRTAFHVTCGLHNRLEMNTILTEEDEVKFKSYCPEHSGLEGKSREDNRAEESEGAREKRRRRRGRMKEEQEEQRAPPGPPPGGLNIQQQQEEEQRVSLRRLKLQQLEEDFYQCVDVGEVAQCLAVAQQAVDFVFQYWKLKRRAGFNQPLLRPRQEEEESLARCQHAVLLRRLQLFTHLRQDLERVRNLTYMVTRREKMKRALLRVQEQVLQQQLRQLDQQQLTGDASTKASEERMPLESGVRSARGTAATRGSRRKERGKAGHRRSPVQVPTNQRGREDQHTPVKEEESHTRLERPDEVRSPRVQPSGARGSVWVGGLYPDLQQRRVSVVLTRLRPDAEQHMEQRRRSGRRERSLLQTRTRLGTCDRNSSAEDSPGDCRPSTQPMSAPSKPPGGQRKEPCARANGLLSAAVGSHLKNWGKFRIPRRSERASEVLETPPQPSKVPSRPACSPREPSYPRTRLRTGTEGSLPGAEPCVRRCHSHQLRGDSALARRYCADIIRQGVLAS